MEATFAKAIQKNVIAQNPVAFRKQEQREMARGTVVIHWNNGKFDIGGRDGNGNKIKIPFPVDTTEPALARAIMRWAEGERYVVQFTHAGNYACWGD
jgi:hypothetical protein